MSQPEMQEKIEKARSPFAEAWGMFLGNYAAVAALGVLILIILGATAA